MEGLLLVVVLGATVLVGTAIGQRYSVAPPVLLITFGALLALIPALSDVRLPSDVVLLLFLPPILYWESLNTSLREIRSNLRVIILSAVVLVIVVTVLVQGLTLPAVVRWSGQTGDEAREEETRLARIRASEEALRALPDVATRFGAPDEVVARIREDYEGHLEQLRAEGPDHGVQAWQDQVDRRVRLEVLDHKRRAVTRMRDDREIDDIVLRDLQASMDIEEVRLLGPAPTD
ncbi:cation:proton antiporter [Asanoa sp. WMMD1127]|uniref:cation:proton antiporter domain-containing protein n=1 Tax=Asanoa sp. WMMD1127 TaxID=3016107 RepID=UPI002416B1A5|nr:cation:proton antiporter [Asanoa sp. WMMD1127]MDG4825645.1 cation:proton antiporter [Asanoa sp. WMMD1127]